jgi:hypothetical protein
LNVGLVNQPLEETFNRLANLAHHAVVILFSLAQLLAFRLLSRSQEDGALLRPASLEKLDQEKPYRQSGLSWAAKWLVL